MNKLGYIGHIGHSILLNSKQYFDLAKPDSELVCLKDIAAALSKICRFGGHIREFYSVAEHCILASKEAAKAGYSWEECRALLLHDAVEAYVGDMVKPLKVLVGAPYMEVERDVEHAIELAFGIKFADHKEVIKRFDIGMLIAEKRFFFGADEVEWWGESSAIHITPRFRCYPWKDAEKRFIKHYLELAK